MAMLLCCGEDGLLEYQQSWRTLSCPLPCPSLIAGSASHRAILDNTEHLLWLNDRLLPVASGIECLLIWRDHPLLLSGDTNALTLLDPVSGTPMFLAPGGVYPQDMCLLPGNAAAVCGGDIGKILLLQLPDLQLIRHIPVPGSARRLARLGRWLYILCATEDDASPTLLCRADLRSDRYEPLRTLPGLPGALYADDTGIWAAVSDKLYHFVPQTRTFTERCRSLGLVQHITGMNHCHLLSDTLLGALFLLEPHKSPRLLKEGDAGQAIFI